MNRLTHDERIGLYKRVLFRSLLCVSIFFVFTYILPRFFSLFAPFIFAFIMAYFLNPLVTHLQKRIKLPRRLLSLVIVVLVFFSLASLLVWFIQSLAKETISLAKNIQVIWDYMVSSLDLLTQRLNWLLDLLPGDTEAMLSELMDTVLLWLQNASKDLADYIISNSVTITTSVGNGVVTTVIFIMSAYFITADYPGLSAKLGRFIDAHVHHHYHVIKNAALSAFGGYIKAQLLLALFASIVMFTALAVYGQEYALLIAIVLGFIDFLPFIGTTIVLVPWSILCIIGDDLRKGIFLLVLAGSFFLVRRLVEPKIMSTQTGLPPLFTLISIYAGMKLAGVWGMILGPIIVMIAIGVIKAGIFENTVKDIQAIVEDIGSIL